MSTSNSTRNGPGQPKKYGEKTVQVGLSMPESLRDRIDQLEGVRKGEKRSTVIVRLIATILEDDDYDCNIVSKIPYEEIIG